VRRLVGGGNNVGPQPCTKGATKNVAEGEKLNLELEDRRSLNQLSTEEEKNYSSTGGSVGGKAA